MSETNDNAWKRLFWLVGEREKYRRTIRLAPLPPGSRWLTFEEWQASSDSKTQAIGQEPDGDKGEK